MWDANYAYSLITNVDEPRTMKEEIKIPNLDSWLEATNEEMVSLKKNETWILVPFPEGKKAIGCKWVFKRKTGLDGNIEKYKMRLVAKGYS